jgi:hypothetical protein
MVVAKVTVAYIKRDYHALRFLSRPYIIMQNERNKLSIAARKYQNHRYAKGASSAEHAEICRSERTRDTLEGVQLQVSINGIKYVSGSFEIALRAPAGYLSVSAKSRRRPNQPSVCKSKEFYI